MTFFRFYCSIISQMFGNPSFHLFRVGNRALKSHAFAVSLRHFNQLTRSLATSCISHTEKGSFVEDEAQAYAGRSSAELMAVCELTAT